MALVVAGTVVPMARGAEEAAAPGAVWIDDAGVIEAVTREGEAGPSGYDTAPRVEAGDALVLPGLVDLHSHLGYNMLPLWVEPSQKTPFLHHDIWPGEATYGPDVSWTAWTLIDRAPECVFAYVQARALAGGTTSIQGWPSASRPPTNRLVRSVDNDRIGALADPVMVSALTLDASALRRRRDGFDAGSIFIYHCAEGQPESRVVAEFTALGQNGCLQSPMVAIHATALDRTHFDHWRTEAAPAAGETAGTVVWSPFSNLWLYGVTTLVPEALGAGLGVCLGTDWGPSGTKNLLGELKVARLWSDAQGWGLTDHDLVRMVTAVPGDAVGRAWQRPAGRLLPGGLGDVVVLARRHADIWRSVVTARERDVGLTVLSGQARWGTKALMDAAGQQRTTSVPIGGTSRRLVLVRPDDPSRTWVWRDVLARLDAVRASAAVDPPRGPAGSGGRRRGGGDAASGSGDPPGTPPLKTALDMPGAGSQASGGPPPAGRTVIIPPIEPLHHDRRWLASIPGRGFHGGALDRLSSFYR
jgi:cytosine/adenosine deaminase-related metal-dependent hydrolase